MKILIDTREQAPFTFQGYDVDPEPATLPVGDYSLVGFEDRAAVERKSLDDLVGCLMGSNGRDLSVTLPVGGITTCLRLW